MRKRIKLPAIFILCTVPLLGFSQTAEEKDRLERTAKSFVEVYNSGDSAAYTAYLNRFLPSRTVGEGSRRFYNTWRSLGAIKVISKHCVGARHIELLTLQEKYGSWWKFNIHTDSLQNFLFRTVQPIVLPEQGLKQGVLSSLEISKQVDEYITNTLGADFSGNVLILRRGETIFDRSYGADQSKRPNQRSTSFGLASAGKMFTAVAILQLRDAGKLSLTDSVRRFFPELKNENVLQLTIGQLLTHTSGLGDYFEDPNYIEGVTNLNDPVVRMKFIENAHWSFSKKNNWVYSNTGFLLLGSIIERVSNVSFTTYVKSNIFQKLDMRHALVGIGSGGGEATVEDMSKFLLGLKNAKLLNTQTTGEILNYRINANYGYGTEHHQIGSEHIIGHSGGFINQCVELNLYPVTDHLVVILSNSSPPLGHYLSNKIKELLVRR